MTSAVFRTSLYGRFGHAVMAVLGLIVAVLCGLPLYIRGIQPSDVWLALAGIGLCLLGVWVAVYSGWFALAPGERIACSREKLTYRGILKSVSLAWSEIASVRLHYGGRSPFVFLLVRGSERQVEHKLNVAGLSPSYEVLVSLIRRIASHVRVQAPVGLGIGEAIADELANGL